MVAPTVIAGRYWLVRRLGVGGQGEVYEARDDNEGPSVAVKLFPPTSTPDWLEARILRALQGHFILPIHNADTHLGQPYLVTALAGFGSVDQHVIPGVGLTIDEAIAWTRHGCLGVARGHAFGLVHNDIKPANLFLNDKREAVVADWGYAGIIDPTTGVAPCPGATADTVAPEVAATWGTGIHAASIASDVYSLGASAFMMLAGVPPVDFAGAAGLARIAVAATATRSRLRDAAPHVPKGIADAVDKALAFAPGDRFVKPQDFYAALGRRERVQRRWVRTNEHATHVGCFRGYPTGSGTEMLVCATPSTGRKVDIRTTHEPSGRAVSAGCCATTLGKWVTDVRHVIADHT